MSPYRFGRRLNQAKAYSIFVMKCNLPQGFDWRAAAWLLARRFPHWRDKPIVSQDTRDTLDELKVKRSELELHALRYQLETLKAKEDSLDLLEVLGEGAYRDCTKV